MATGSKRQKIEEKLTESEDNGKRRKRKAGNMFLRPDIILVVEGIQLHVRKEVLADNSPVFKRMFEADFKEKHQKKIPLPEESIEDFEEFLCLIYHPERWQITGTYKEWLFYFKYATHICATSHICING